MADLLDFCGANPAVEQQGCAVDKFTSADKDRLRTLLSDFVMFCAGDQGRIAGITTADRQWLAGAIGRIKGLADTLVYGGGA